jgi:23S rRNA pseudouridine955/2504/2580 synthase
MGSTHTVSYITPIRLDRFLKQHYPLITQGVIQQALRHNFVKLNGQKVKNTSVRLNQGDVVALANFFSQYQSVRQKVFNDSTKSLSQKLLSQYLLFDGDDFIVINKPAKIASQGGSNLNISIDHALQYLNTQQGDFKLVHRLDKDTSGLMFIAKNYDGAVKITKAFADKMINKTYLALVQGSLLYNCGTVTLTSEVTHYRLLQYFPSQDVSYVEFKPVTGKEHQIRRHALELGVSIIGDKKYGSATNNMQYMLLHSSVGAMDQQIFGRRLEFTAPLPCYFEQYLNTLL